MVYFIASIYYFSVVLPHDKIANESFFGDSETRLYAFDRLLVLMGAVFFLLIEFF